jgi:hypothetical protein
MQQSSEQTIWTIVFLIVAPDKAQFQVGTKILRVFGGFKSYPSDLESGYVPSSFPHSPIEDISHAN